jgi:hypothetical protein
MSWEKWIKGKCWNSVGHLKAGLLILLFTMVSAGLHLPGAAKAEEGYGPGTDRFKISLGGYFPSIDTEAKIDGIQVGDPIDLEDELHLSDNDSIFRVDGYWRFFKRHRLGLGYYKLSRDANRVLDTDIKIGDETFPTYARVATELDLGFYTIDYMYSFYQGEKWEISGGLGAYWVDLEFSVAASLDVNNDPIDDALYESTDFNGPLPYLGLGFEYYITPKWLAMVKGGYFQLEVGDVDGKLMNMGAKLEYQFTKMFGLGLGYDYFRIDADITDGNKKAELTYNYSGVQAYGILRF